MTAPPPGPPGPVASPLLVMGFSPQWLKVTQSRNCDQDVTLVIPPVTPLIRLVMIQSAHTPSSSVSPVFVFSQPLRTIKQRERLFTESCHVIFCTLFCSLESSIKSQNSCQIGRREEGDCTLRHLTPITVRGPPGHDVFLFIIITNKNKMGLLLAKYKHKYAGRHHRYQISI